MPIPAPTGCRIACFAHDIPRPLDGKVNRHPAALARRGIYREPAVGRVHTVSHAVKTKTPRRVHEQVVLPVEACAVVVDLNRDLIAGVTDDDLGRINLRVPRNVAQQLADHLEYPYPGLDHQLAFVDPAGERDVEAIAAAHVDGQPLQGRAKADIVQPRWTDIRNQLPGVLLDVIQFEARSLD